MKVGHIDQSQAKLWLRTDFPKIGSRLQNINPIAIFNNFNQVSMTTNIFILFPLFNRFRKNHESVLVLGDILFFLA